MKTLDTFVNSTKYGVKLSRKGNFAYLTDQPSLDFYNQRKPCNTMLVKDLLDAKSYAFGLQRNSEWTNELSVTLLQVSKITSQTKVFNLEFIKFLYMVI
jgi:hypothetical protein